MAARFISEPGFNGFPECGGKRAALSSYKTDGALNSTMEGKPAHFAKAQPDGRISNQP
jgi:hypothetical protein